MPRKIAVFVGALALAASALLTGVVGAAIPVALGASYNGPCTGTAHDQNNYHYYIHRTGNSYDRMQGNTVVGT
jgi:hypothetical protein